MSCALAALEAGVGTANDVADALDSPGYVHLCACPLMHGTGMWVGGFIQQLMGACVVLLQGRSFDPDELCADGRIRHPLVYYRMKGRRRRSVK